METEARAGRVETPLVILADTNASNRRRQGWICLALAVLTATAAWVLPARWRSIHPTVLQRAGVSTPGLVEVAVVAAQQQRPGPAERLQEAAATLQLPGLETVTEALAALGGGASDVQLLGGRDPAVAALLPSLAGLAATHPPSAYEVFRPTERRATLLTLLKGSRSPGVQALLQALTLPTREFIPADQAGGEPFEAVVLLAATLYETERFSPTLAREVRDLAEQSVRGDEAPRERMEEFLLNLLSLSRRLDWTSLAELTRKIPDIPAFGQFAATVRQYPEELPLLYAGALLSGDAAGVARHREVYGKIGLDGLSQALRAGAGAVILLTREEHPVRPGSWSADFLAGAVAQKPEAWAYLRSVLLIATAVLVAAGFAGLVFSGMPGRGGNPSWSDPTLLFVALSAGILLIYTSEPLPSRQRPLTNRQAFLDLGALTRQVPVTSSYQQQKNIMESTTLITMVVFGVIQLTVYLICLRKIAEIYRLPAPPSVRLKLLENEENLFDSGLYVGIGGTAAALVMQVLQLVEANLLAAYSSNLMGIICVALVKIGHVRKARRQLILECQVEARLQAAEAAGLDPATAAGVNPFTVR